MRFYSNFDLTNFNSYRIAGICKEAFFPENEDDIVEVYSNNPDLILLGSGHNVILSKSYYDSSFLIFNGNFKNIYVSDSGIIEAEAGASMLEICEIALENSLSGLEIFYDIPSSLGGAVVMNAGASGEEIKDVLIKVRYLDLVDMKVKEIHKDDMNFEYRNSFFQRNTNKIVLKAWLRLITNNKASIKSKMERIKNERFLKQPKDYPNAGSVFKRPKGYYVGAIISELGLKGFSVGGAKISDKHAGFIINTGNATGQDILDIINEIQKRVFDKYKFHLEVEQRII